MNRNDRAMIRLAEERGGTIVKRRRFVMPTESKKEYHSLAGFSKPGRYIIVQGNHVLDEPIYTARTGAEEK